MKFFKLLAWLGGVCCFFVSFDAAAAQNSPSAQDVKKVENYLNSLKTMRADFVQIASNGEQVEGRIYIEKPNKIRMEYDKPADVLIVGNGDYVVYFDKELEQITNIDYEDFFLHFQQNDADMSVAAVPYVVKVPYGVFNLEGRNIKGVTEKPTISYYANAGIYLIKKERLELIPENEFFNATDFMDLLITKGYKVIRYPISGYWIDIGQHDELERAREIAKHIF